MREIKYRVWLKKEKQMCSILDINFHNETVGLIKVVEKKR